MFDPTASFIRILRQHVLERLAQPQTSANPVREGDYGSFVASVQLEEAVDRARHEIGELFPSAVEGAEEAARGAMEEWFQRGLPIADDLMAYRSIALGFARGDLVEEALAHHRREATRNVPGF